MRYYLAIDIGASSGRHILGWLENGRIKTEEIYRFANGPEETTENGKKHLKWQHKRLFEEILNGLKKAKEIEKIPYSVGIDTWGVDYVLLDENDEAIEGAYCYRDDRTDATTQLVHGTIDFNSLYKITGIQFATFNTIYQLFDDKLSGRMEKAKSFLMLPDYFHFLLTGVKKQEYTEATTSGLVNAKTHCWDYDLIDKLGYKKELFRPLSQPSELVGEFKSEVAKEVGYTAKVVLPATHDTASAVLAAPLKKGAPYISSGTWSLLGVERHLANTSDEARESGYSNEGSLNFNVRFQKTIMGLWLIQQLRRELKDDYDFKTLTNMARENKVEDIIDVNSRRFLAPKNMKAEIEAAVGRDLSVGEAAYIIYNSLARDYSLSIKALETVTGEKYDTLHIIGGGSQNDLLNELTEEKTKMRVIAGPTESSALGNLLVQMIGSGECENVIEARKIIKNSL